MHERHADQMPEPDAALVEHGHPFTKGEDVTGFIDPGLLKPPLYTLPIRLELKPYPWSRLDPEPDPWKPLGQQTTQPFGQ
jgi:hypothetical protein